MSKEHSRDTLKIHEIMIVKREEDGSIGQLDIVLDSATVVVTELLVVAQLLKEGSMEGNRCKNLRRVLAIAQQILEKHFEPQVFFHLYTTTPISPKQAVELIAWLTKYLRSIGQAETESHE